MEGIRGCTRSATVVTAAEPTGDRVVERADEFLAWLGTTTGAGVDDAVRIDRIAALERVKGALAAAQVRQTVAFAASQQAGMPPWTPERAVARSIGSQVALARGESPTRGDAHVALATALTQTMPQTLAALTAGRVSEAAAEGVHRAVEEADSAVRRVVDARLVPDLGRLGERALAEAARRVVADVDQEAVSRRVERAVRGRRVTLRTAPDGMAYLTVLAPMAEAAGAFQAVEAEATARLGEPARRGPVSRRSAFWLDDPGEQSPTVAPSGRAAFVTPGEVRRTRSQMMADVVIARLTGRAIGQPVPIEIQLVMTDTVLHQEGNVSEARPGSGRRPDDPASPETDRQPNRTARSGANSPAKIVGAGWLPAGFARELVRRTAAAGSDVTVRRVVTGRDGATVIGLEARRRRLREQQGPPQPIPVLAPTGSMQRLFRGVLRRLVVVRDQTCRTPFCAAAIRAVDHITPARRDGPTCAHNAAGTCDRCNLTKEAPGWNVIVLSPPPVARSNPSDPPWKQLMDELLAGEAQQETNWAQPEGGHRSAVVTPTGHRYESTAPPVTGLRHSQPRAG